MFCLVKCLRVNCLFFFVFVNYGMDVYGLSKNLVKEFKLLFGGMSFEVKIEGKFR